ncbi:MAG: hypothetical protein KTR25_15645 [Myxococcales bacterium]|nr:hypothetical protein [Myxococcales bacterium]
MSSTGLIISRAIRGSLLIGIGACDVDFTRNSGALELHISGITQEIERISVLVQRTGRDESSHHVVDETSRTDPTSEHSLLVNNVPEGMVYIYVTPQGVSEASDLPTRSARIYVSANTTAKVAIDLTVPSEPAAPLVIPGITYMSETISTPVILQSFGTRTCKEIPTSSVPPTKVEICDTKEGVYGKFAIGGQGTEEWYKARDYFGAPPVGIRLDRLAIELEPSQLATDQSKIWKNPVTASLESQHGSLIVGTAPQLPTTSTNILEFTIKDIKASEVRKIFSTGEVFLVFAGSPVDAPALPAQAQAHIVYKFSTTENF